MIEQQTVVEEKEIPQLLADKLHVGNKGAIKKFIESKNIGQDRYFDSKTWLLIYRIVNSKLKMDNDHFVCVTGVEGTGKSTLAIKIASVIDPNFKIDQIAYSAASFYRLVRKLPRGSVIIIDEAHRLLSADLTRTKDHHDLVLLLQEMRQAGLCVILCLPYFRGLTKYLREHRVDNLFMISRRGHFKFANRKALSIINQVTTKMRDMQPNQVKIPNGTFYHGYFTMNFPSHIEKPEYDKLKEQKFYEFVDSKIKTLDQKGDPIDKPLNATEASQLSGYDTTKIRSLAMAGAFDYQDLGRYFRYPRKSFLKWLDSITSPRENAK
tara:strand:- start:578 stop:1546 length:969 start_codon:yes stop_codon:yes gene_type:complete